MMYDDDGHDYDPDDHLMMPLSYDMYEPIFHDRDDEQISWSIDGVPSSSATLLQLLSSSTSASSFSYSLHQP